MAQYFTDDFADFPADWTERYNAPTSGAFSVVSGDLQLPSGKSGDWCMQSWNDIDGDADRAEVEILFLTQVSPSFTSTTPYLAMVRAGGADEAVDGFAVAINSAQLRTSYMSAGDAANSLVTANHGLTLVAGETEVWIRFRVSGTGTKTVQAKVWIGAIGDEPASWLCDGTTANGPDAAGWVGPAVFGVSAQNAWVFRQFGVGTNGDSAPSSGTSGASGAITVTTEVVGVSITGEAPVNATVNVTTVETQVSITGSAGSASNNIRLQPSLYLERGGYAASLTADRWIVFTSDLSAVEDTGTALSINSTGQPTIDITGSVSYTVGDYVPLFLTVYDEGSAAADRTVRTFFGWVQAQAQA